MDQHVARLRPAQIVATTSRVPLDVPTLPRRETLAVTFHQRQELAREVHRLARRGEIGTTYRTREVPGGWVAEVVRIKEPGRRWGKPAAWAVGVALGLTLAAWLLVLAVQALVGLLPYLIGGAVVLAVLAGITRATLGGEISISQSVNIK